MKKIVIAGILLLGSAVLLAHPHFVKSIEVELPSGVKATITYQTTPANESRAESAAPGTFVVPRGPRLQLSGEINSGGTTVAAGEYTIGVIKNGENDWTMGLYPGRIGRGESPDMSKVIKLDSVFSNSRGAAEHMLIDVNPGFGRLEGKPVLTVHFGSLYLAGALG